MCVPSRRAPHAGAHPLDDQAAVEFCDSGDDNHNGYPFSQFRAGQAGGFFDEHSRLS